MDAMDVLGALLGRKSSSGGGNGNILKDMLGGGRQSSPATAPESRTHPQMQKPKTISGAARSLEEMLGVSPGESADHNEYQPPTQQRAPQPTPRQPAPQSPAPASPSQRPLDAQSMILIRAMISAAKSDGQIDQSEQDHILKQVGQASQQDIDFLRQEFGKPVDVRQLAWDVPMGIEEQVYTISLLAIDLDENKEAQYLAELAHGLRITPSKCNAIHRQYRAPEIFRES